MQLTPSPRIPTKRLTEIQANYYRSVGGKEFIPEEVESLLLSRYTDRPEKKATEYNREWEAFMSKPIYLVRSAIGGLVKITETPDTGYYPDKIIQEARIPKDLLLVKATADTHVSTGETRQESIPVKQITSSETECIEDCFAQLLSDRAYFREYLTDYHRRGIVRDVTWLLKGEA